MVGAMSFLEGIGVAGKIDFCKVGTGMPETDFAGKGERVIRMLCEGYDLVVCHINAPDEASHMRSLELKIACIEKIDQYIAGPVYEYFHYNQTQLGGVMVIPDHYTNVFCGQNGKKRIASHAVDPVPFALWNGESRDRVSELTEEAVLGGKYGGTPLPSLCLIDLLTKRKN
jgi:2,3-bisphosphoglycerate-independent phosphoglycerate mutase